MMAVRCVENFRDKAETLVVNLGLGIVAFLALVFIGDSYFRRDLGHLVIAAWSFILFGPLLQFLLQSFAGVGDAEEEVKYELTGCVVKVQDRENLAATGTELYEMVAPGTELYDMVKVAADDGEINNESYRIFDKRELWYHLNEDKEWYRKSYFSFWFTIAKAVLNISSIINTPIEYHLLSLDYDEPGRVGITWVVSIEIPYMVLFLLPFFVFSALQLRCLPQLAHEAQSNPVPPEQIKLIVRLSGLLKSLGRFSALNLLEFIHVDEFMSQDRMQRMLSIIGAVIGFMAFRVKLRGIAFVVNRHAQDWTFGQWFKVIALINNMLSIANTREKMMSVAIETREYRKDRWLEAVAAHLLSTCSGCRLRAFKRLVTMGPHDVNRLFEDFRINEIPCQTSGQTEHVVSRIDADEIPRQTSGQTEHVVSGIDAHGIINQRRQKIPKEISSDCWSWQLTNIVGVVRYGLFRALADTESTPYRKQTLLQGTLNKVAEEQFKVQQVRKRTADVEAQLEALREDNRTLREVQNENRILREQNADLLSRLCGY